jgi:uroporphyrinogen III methyltransferase/synthase
LSATPSIGTVYLVGAGPGDPGLLTVRGAELLAQAHVVVYDQLANPRLLSYCPLAELIYVGKQAAAHAMPQERINQLLIEKARGGHRVVRLKGGDPFVFGRGGEECAALAAAGVRFEVVPGITAGIAALAYAGIPATHRDFNSTFTLVTGHEKPGAPSDIQWPVLAKLPCLAFYMGVSSLGEICRQLIEHGMPPDTPAATIQSGTLPQQRTITSNLRELPGAAAGLGTPAITVVGEIVTMRQTLNWFETRPLFGRTIVVTRTRQQASELSRRLEELGAAVIEAPTIELSPPDDPAAVDAALASAGKFDWIVFTSANGVSSVRDRLLASGQDVRALGAARIAVIGDATAAAVQNLLCRAVDLCPARFVAEALADELIERDLVRGRRFLLLRADIARPLLRDRLTEAGAAQVDDVAVYQTQRAASLPTELVEALERGDVHWITFTSSSTARNFVELLGPDYAKQLKGIRLASIGPITTQTLRELKLRPSAAAEQFNIGGLIQAMVKHA